MKKKLVSDYKPVDPALRLCLLCKNAYFENAPPLSGECRISPPRSYLEGGRPGRFFPMVKFDDWCGQHRAISDDVRQNELLKMVAPFRSRVERLKHADRIYESQPREAMEFYESIYSGGSDDAEIAYRIGYGYYRRFRKEQNPEDGASAAKWLSEAILFDHIEAPLTLAFMFANGTSVGLDIAKANELLKVAADRGNQVAVKKLAEGGFLDRDPQATTTTDAFPEATS